MSEILIENPILGVKKKPAPNPTNWQFSEHPSCMAKPEKLLPKKKSIKDKFGKVYNQGRTGSCTSNAVLACDAYYYHDPNGTWEPSTIFTYYNQKKDEKPMIDDGDCIENALDMVRKYGACSAKVWPNTKPFNKKPSKEAYANGLKGHELTKYYQVKSLTQIKKALASNYPVAIAVAWCFRYIDGNTWIMNTPTDEEIEDCDSGHAIVLVGYDDETRLFEFRNSWSELWGNKGYAYFTYDTLKRVIWYDDSYAVVK